MGYATPLTNTIFYSNSEIGKLSEWEVIDSPDWGSYYLVDQFTIARREIIFITNKGEKEKRWITEGFAVHTGKNKGAFSALYLRVQDGDLYYYHKIEDCLYGPSFTNKGAFDFTKGLCMPDPNRYISGGFKVGWDYFLTQFVNIGKRENRIIK